MISFLAIAGIFGASSAIVNNEVKETPVVEKAEAATAATTREHTVWLNYSSCGSWFSPYISYKNSSGTWTHKQAMTIVTANTLAKFTLPANTADLLFLTKNLKNNTNKLIFLFDIFTRLNTLFKLE